MPDATLNEDQIIAALKEVDDPEMPISIVDMGMVYAVEFQDGVTKVQLGLTATACPAIDFIFMDIKDRLKQEGCDQVDIELVWDPPWTKERISEEGRFILTTWGLSV